MFQVASPLCKESIITVMRQDRPDVTRPVGGWLDGMDNTRQLAELAFNNAGALVQALAPGCGKTTLIETLTQLLNEHGLVQGVGYLL